MLQKVSIIGGGRVGMTSAYALLLRETARELVLFGRDIDKMKGEQLDFQDMLAFVATAKITATSSFEDTKDSDLIVFTAGVAQEPGESRRDLLGRNIEILESLLPEIIKYSPDAIVMIVSNPVDVLTYKASQMLQLPKGRVFGTGTTLDSARFRFHLSELLRVNPKNIHAYMMGEHGDGSFPAISCSTIGGQALEDIPNISQEQIEACATKAKNTAKEIIEAKGATYYAIGIVVNQLVDAVLGDTKRIFPLSIPLDGEYGYTNIVASVPCVLGKNGVERILECKLSDVEKSQFDATVKILKELL
jgi:L-lactate dehydrogenase